MENKGYACQNFFLLWQKMSKILAIKTKRLVAEELVSN